MRNSGTWVIRYAGTQVTIAWSGSLALKVLNFLFHSTGHLAPRPVPNPLGCLHVTHDGADPHMVLIHQGEVLYEGDHIGRGAGILLDWAMYHLAYDCCLGPLFHAAALSFDGRGILLIGESGAGKSTLAAWLASQGHHCLSDEMTCVESPTRTLHAFTRPLHLRDPSVDLLEDRGYLDTAAQDVDGQGCWQSDRGWLVPVTQLNPNHAVTTPEVDLILFPRFEAGAACRIICLSPAQTVMNLMSGLINARNLPGHGFDEITRLAQHIPAYSLTYSRLDPIAEQIEAWLTSGGGAFL